MADCIYLTGLRAFGYSGYLEAEQVLGQWFQVDLTLWVDLSKAAESDRLEDTYDYRNNVATVLQLIRTERFRLIERLAGAIAQIMLSSGQVEQVTVRLTKVNPPIPDFTGQVAVEITRSRK
ncbi:dihydroneopterin aldolase [Thermoleptolyngbya oregonensis NK1-22]|jgi:dihydroneopterin aldolase|uniref:7,8-dihydroneopterin aldolase n=1 Tax=Thermoleptolyngbya oregonensis NK1-22 TaxID=2547457 RepID=A0AA97BAR4_9CYAN|nr:dihydroneopterin aldolase [Thermoleptolyngbya sp. M55_K2018_002]WOB45025.1 dihydroneopterin aldolase [Thermoleptolyngbya oregonensis NK1-22]HIK41482.1 dihydroneopterin aldolase [Thermoleptolyngbya sp. M55_K2018_002]